MDEHRAREDELLDLKVLRAEFPQQPTGPLHGDLLVLGARLAEEIIVGGEMDHRGDVRPVVLTDGAESVAHALVGRDLDGDVDAARRRRRGRLAVEADDVLEAPGEPPHHGVADPAVGAGDDDDPAVRFMLPPFFLCGVLPFLPFSRVAPGNPLFFFFFFFFFFPPSFPPFPSFLFPPNGRSALNRFFFFIKFFPPFFGFSSLFPASIFFWKTRPPHFEFLFFSKARGRVFIFLRRKKGAAGPKIFF